MEPNQKIQQGCLAMLARTAMVRLIAVGVVLLLVVGSCGVGGIVGSFAGGLWGLMVGTVFFGVVLFVGGFAYGFITVYRRNQYLDAAFTPLGLKGTIYRLVFRQYTGVIDGREVEVFFARGPMLDVLVRSRLKTRLGISPAFGDTSFFANLVDAKPLEHNISDLKNIRLWAEEDSWTRNLIAEPSVRQHLIRLLSGQTFFVRSYVKFFPDYLHLHFSGNTNVFTWELPPDQVQAWFKDLFALLRFAETGIPAPTNPIEMTSAEKFALSIRRKDTTKFTVIMVAGMLLFFFLIFVVSVAVVSLLG